MRLAGLNPRAAAAIGRNRRRHRAPAAAARPFPFLYVHAVTARRPGCRGKATVATPALPQ